MQQLLVTVIVRVIALFTVIPVHEFGHALVSYKLGDPTAKNQGRLTLNPIAHLDPLGSLCMLLTGIGWGKTPINPYFYRNQKKGLALTALAGPMANVLLALVLIALVKVMSLVALLVPALLGSAFYLFLIQMLGLIAQINISIAVINLLPVPPFDGFRILAFFVPAHVTYKLQEYQTYISLAVLMLLLLGFLDWPIQFLTSFIYKGLGFLTGFIDLIARAIV
ncbi:site-2 protease family protein [Bittarella massiliensis]|uniref:site-2 protease family protein n=1 Tax=Bittarella massiliensis (ex Durand et al. 2017) TaxID=1720313 RepID=UPI00163B82C2|nr:site-2 protease family protein [Bittarella massiliensis (ex Durand et al. 2017)]MBC2870475.1 site-2 protease family protein [Bittarella massiliensis (ex Durand et al. 2017)]